MCSTPKMPQQPRVPSPIPEPELTQMIAEPAADTRKKRKNFNETLRIPAPRNSGSGLNV